MKETVLYRGAIEKYKETDKAMMSYIESLGVELPLTYFIQVGDNKASNLYISNKIKQCKELGIPYKLIKFEDYVTSDTLVEFINLLNKDNSVSGIMVQLPLPSHLDEGVIKQLILPEKDIDGFHYSNVGRVMCEGVSCNTLCCATPLGITRMIDYYGIETEGKNIVVIGRSDIVGRPIANILSGPIYNGTVTICHSKTKDLASYTKRADLIISAVGKAKFLTRDMVKPECSIIDVGINRDSNGKLCGDVDTEGMLGYVDGISPVPGGVGLSTVSALTSNIISCIHTRCMKNKTTDHIVD
ncbi:MAG: bifunctional 5,10-methylenetetrahydrofolate dehydrogenase/5,10-methenyltetrahydrofolate cyclohydrolase [Bacteroidales bacterium]